MSENEQSSPMETARKRAGLTQSQLAEAVGLTQSAISLYESDRRRIRLDDAGRIARVLGVPVDALVRTEAA